MSRADAAKANSEIIAFLDYYTDRDRDFDFAVLLSGPWGSGKTHLLKSYLQTAPVKPLYVSLYGMTHTSQIEEQFYRQIHPFLASKGMKVVGAIARAAVKGTLKVDLNGDGKEDGTWSAGLPEIDLTKELGNPRERLLVFDDLERCQMTVSEVLGYINSFVEHDGLKAILVANEQELLRRADQRYADVKEKLIGQTLRVTAPVEDAYTTFLETIIDPVTKAFLEKHRSEVLDVHRAGGENNLRVLKQALWDFERISRHCLARHWAKDAAMAKALSVVIALSLEHRSGRLADGQITRLLNDRFGRAFRAEATGQKGPEAAIEARYPQIDFDNTVLDATLLEGVLVGGQSDGDTVRKVLDNSSAFATPAHQPLWLRAWNSMMADDDDVEQIVAEIERAFAARDFVVPGEILHAFGLRLWFTTIGLMPVARAAIVSECKAYIDDLHEHGRLPGSLDADDAELRQYHASRAFMESETPEFLELSAYLHAVMDQVSKAQYLSISLHLLRKLNDSPQEFLLDLVVNGFRASPYQDVPVLAALPQAFVAEVVLGLSADKQVHFLQVIHGRHEHRREGLSAEREWLADLHDAIIAGAQKAKPMSRYRLTNLTGRYLAPLLPKRDQPV
jgi:hypothetical protein